MVFFGDLHLLKKGKNSIMKKIFVKVFLLLAGSPVLAQLFPPKNYPGNYFRDPLNIPISLAANFGELRPNHYHMGLDIRTERRENLPVYAAADGYIARVKIEPWGFGQAIYINHPNGYTTLYAHLNAFYPALAAYVRQQQYNMESWKVFLNIPPGLFPVKKGDLIAYSGNTGGSQGPHLHFEIRRTADDTNLNPMLFGLPVPDNTSPVIQRLALYDLGKSVYEQVPQIYPVHKAGSDYSITPDLITTAARKIGFAISAFDTQSGSVNPNGIYEAVLYNNEQELIGFQMDNISYEDTKNINAHIDYKTKANGGPYLQQLFALPGATRSIYRPPGGSGAVDIGDGLVHNIRIAVRDAYGNSTVLNCKIQYREGPATVRAVQGKIFYPMMLDGYEAGDCAFYIGERCLYDSVHIAYTSSTIPSPGVVSAVHGIGAAYIPLQDSFLVRIRPNINLAASKLNKVVMERWTGGEKELSPVEWQNGWASARFRGFGNFQLLLDETAPLITPLGFKDGANLRKATRLAFSVKDNSGEIKSFRAELDPPAAGRSGKWICFSNDKGRSFVYKFDEHCGPGKHELKVTAEDESGNVAVKIFRFTR